MKLQRKAFDLLNLRDFESSPIWLVELPDRAFATAVEPVDDIAVYGPYVALTVYSLADALLLVAFASLTIAVVMCCLAPRENPSI